VLWFKKKVIFLIICLSFAYGQEFVCVNNSCSYAFHFNVKHLLWGEFHAMSLLMHMAINFISKFPSICMWGLSYKIHMYFTQGKCLTPRTLKICKVEWTTLWLKEITLNVIPLFNKKNLEFLHVQHCNLLIITNVLVYYV